MGPGSVLRDSSLRRTPFRLVCASCREGRTNNNTKGGGISTQSRYIDVSVDPSISTALLRFSFWFDQ